MTNPTRSLLRGMLAAALLAALAAGPGAAQPAAPPAPPPAARTPEPLPEMPKTPENEALASWLEAFFPWGAGKVRLEEITQVRLPGGHLVRAQKSFDTDSRLNDQVFAVLEEGGKHALVGDVFVDTARMQKPAPVKTDADLAGLQEALKKYLRAPFRLTLDPATDRKGFRGVKLRIDTGYGNADVPALVKADDGLMILLGRAWDRHRPVPEQRRELMHLESTPVAGSPDAKVTVVEYSDMECGYCKRRSASWDTLTAKLASVLKIKRYIKNFPLTSDHPWAFRAASAGRCFFELDPALYFRFKKEVYAQQETLSIAALDNFALDFATANNIPDEGFKSCYLQAKSVTRVLADIAEGYTMRVRATPTFYVDGVLVSWFNDNVMEEYLRTVYLKGAGLPLPTIAAPPTPLASPKARGRG
jgi:protein-disulfide isomerase